MQFKELLKKSPDELTKEIDSALVEMMRFNAQVATGSAGKDVGKIKELRRKIAKIKTIQNKK